MPRPNFFPRRFFGEDRNIRATPTQQNEILEVKVDLLNGGLRTDVDFTLIENNQFWDISNCWLDRDRLRAPAGISTNFTWGNATPIVASRILGLQSLIRSSGQIECLRFTKSSVHKIAGATWTPLTGPALVGGDYDRFQVIFARDGSGDKIFFNNNGANVLMTVDFAANTYAATGNARRYKYYTVFANRIIGANLLSGTPDPTEIAGSGNLNFSQWDPLIDPSSFINKLIVGTRHGVDEITGLKTVGENLILFRRNTIWVGTAQPIASNPIAWNRAKSDLGCDIPDSIQVCEDNIVIWADLGLRSVFLWKVGAGDPQSISVPIDQDLFARISEAKNVFSLYNPDKKFYRLFIEDTVSGRTLVYTYHLPSNSWWKEVRDRICFAASVLFPTNSVTWDSAAGSWDSAVGTWDSYNQVTLVPYEIFGNSSGLLYRVLYDRVHPSQLLPNEGFSFATKAFSFKTHDIHLLQFELDVQVFGTATPVVSIAVNSTKFGLSKYVKSVSADPTQIGVQTLKVPKNIVSRGLYFLISANPGVQILGYRAKFVRGGVIR